MLDEEVRRKEKEEFIKKQQKVKETLENQITKQKELKEQELKQKQEFATWIKQVDSDDLEKERQKKLLIQQKVIEAKRMRDQMLDEANKKRMAEKKANWAQEQDRSQKLEAELKAEKERLKQKREEEKIAARRVIIENEEEKRRRIEK